MGFSYCLLDSRLRGKTDSTGVEASGERFRSFLGNDGHCGIMGSMWPSGRVPRLSRESMGMTDLLEMIEHLKEAGRE